MTTLSKLLFLTMRSPKGTPLMVSTLRTFSAMMPCTVMANIKIEPVLFFLGQATLVKTMLPFTI